MTARAPGAGPFLRRIEAALQPLEARPHLGKIFFDNPVAAWPESAWRQFWKVRDALDPERRFDSPFLIALARGLAMDSGLP